ncbi:polysaccharide biosynthesis tyrosine autokinase [Novipirellula artificiosorum]|uniref:non-specific protein-tyrosine kinase n=1 Tax=Novipirellula artificiosorum TaxID=2528016 RepID=A0A5C6DA22_9BACT|nr:polysaccharide biosynthesis tyrosine autokinase [Novipirellula artificiosorum]TWU32621.1 Tyrosine-protein kinase ptk [Novipirellula artificiosorum]
MKTSYDRGLTYSKAPAISGADYAMSDRSGDGGGQGNSPDLLGALWRYRWAVILAGIGGAVLGFLVFLKMPETFESATRLMVESDRPAILDTMTGDLVGGVPSIEILESQLFSDRVVSMAFRDAQMLPFHEEFEGQTIEAKLPEFISVAHKSMELESEIDDVRSASSLVAVLRFQHTNPELAEAAVNSFSDALQAFFNERHKSSRSELIDMISDAMEELHPRLSELERQYRDFRRDRLLVWNNDGVAINPHRERQLFLTGRRSEMVEQMRQKAVLAAAVQSISDQSSDPEIAVAVISQLFNIKLYMPNDSEDAAKQLREEDVQLAQLQLDEQLIPLMIERNKFASQFGVEHPTVRDLDKELTMMKDELRRIVVEQIDRLLEIRQENRIELIDPEQQAREAIDAILVAANAEVSLVQSQIGELEKQIADEKQEAIKLAKDEQDDAAMQREIEQTYDLMSQLEEQWARVSLTEETGGTQVVELTAPSMAMLVSPILIKCLGIGIFLGLVLGSGVALLLEKNANTFRDPDEISELLGVPVLTHVPFFKGRQKRLKEGEIDPYKDLDKSLGVLHHPASVAAEAIRSCRTAVFFDTASVKGGKVVQVTSPLPGDGKTTVAGNLACSIAQSGKRVLAIDCDLRRPQFTDNFALQDKMGLTNVLNGECDPEDACHQTPVATLRVMPSGPIPANPAEALTLPEMSELLEMLREEYDFIIIDTPPLLVVTDPSITASMTDGVILTLRVRRKSKPNANESVNILRAVGAKVLGVVINNSDEAGASDGYKGYGYYRYGRYTGRYHRRKSGNGKYYRRSGSNRAAPVVVEGRGIGKMRKPRAAEVVSSEGNGVMEKADQGL